eukprot:scaffold652343_cov46-Prasinocladus_malaysianus.AAC.1
MACTMSVASRSQLVSAGSARTITAARRLHPATFPLQPKLRPSFATLRASIRASRSSLSVQASIGSSVADRIEQPPRVVPATLPRVYVYDHCPFCVRVRLALGFK